VGEWNAEYALDAVVIANRNLDVSLLVEARTLVNGPAFEKYAFHRIDGLILPLAPDGVDHLNNRAIQSPHEAVGRIAGQFDTASHSGFGQGAVGSADLFDSGSGREIQAQAKRYHCANDERLLDVGRAAFPCLAGEIETTKRIGFPEIDPRTQPIIVVIALLERLSQQDSFAHGLLASVVAENETRSELMQQRTGD
jgi:hypothetical protein